MLIGTLVAKLTMDTAGFSAGIPDVTSGLNKIVEATRTADLSASKQLEGLNSMTRQIGGAEPSFRNLVSSIFAVRDAKKGLNAVMADNSAFSPGHLIAFSASIRASETAIGDLAGRMIFAKVTAAALWAVLIVPPAVVAGLSLLAKNFSEVGDKLAKDAKRVGMSAGEFSAFVHAAGQSGATAEQFAAGMKYMNRFIGDVEYGSSSATATLQRLGLSISDLQGKSKGEQFSVISEAIKNLGDTSLQTKEAMLIFGRGGVDLLPMLQEGKDGIAALTDEAKQLGITISDLDALKAEELNDAFGRYGASLQGLSLAFAATFADVFIAVLDLLTSINAGVGKILAWFRDLNKLSGGWLSHILKVATAFVATLAVLGAIALVSSAVVALWKSAAVVAALAALKAGYAAIAGSIATIFGWSAATISLSLGGIALVAAAVAASYVAVSSLNAKLGGGQDAMNGLAGAAGKTADGLDRSVQRINELTQKAKSLREMMSTPLDKFVKELGELQAARDWGFIASSELKFGREKAAKDFIDAEGFGKYLGDSGPMETYSTMLDKAVGAFAVVSEANENWERDLKAVADGLKAEFLKASGFGKYLEDVADPTRKYIDDISLLSAALKKDAVSVSEATKIREGLKRDYLGNIVKNAGIDSFVNAGNALPAEAVRDRQLRALERYFNAGGFVNDRFSTAGEKYLKAVAAATKSYEDGAGITKKRQEEEKKLEQAFGRFSAMLETPLGKLENQLKDFETVRGKFSAEDQGKIEQNLLAEYLRAEGGKGNKGPSLVMSGTTASYEKEQEIRRSGQNQIDLAKIANEKLEELKKKLDDDAQKKDRHYGDVLGYLRELATEQEVRL